MSGDRDQVIKQALLNEGIRHAESHFDLTDTTDVYNRTYTYWSELDIRGYTYYTELNKVSPSDDKIAMIMMPCWGIIFPPYGTAKLTGLLRKHNYDVDVYDVNIDAYHYLKNKDDVDDFWDSNKFHVWLDANYVEQVHDHLVPLYDEYVEKIVNSDATICGFSVYNTNTVPVCYMIKEIKKRKPDMLILLGGPEVLNDGFESFVEHIQYFDDYKYEYIDYMVKGEGEELLLQIIANYKNREHSDRPIILGSTKSRLDLNNFPMPDYSDYTFSQYTAENGVSIETSRGCIAQCTFCAETWFWKYRYRDAQHVVDEIKQQYYTYNAKKFWIVDSLANGNLREFANIVKALKEANLPYLQWNSYMRNDGRMSEELFSDIKDSGCTIMSYGVESGSQKVLDDMKKKVKVWEIEDNLEKGSAAGIKNHVNWVIGFPTENALDFTHSLQLLYNCRKWIFAISPGMTCGLAPGSDIEHNWKNYDLNWNEKPWDNQFLGNWWTKDYKNTSVHRVIRVILMDIWLRMLSNNTGGTLFNSQDRPYVTDFYTFETTSNVDIVPTRTEQVDLDVDIFTGESTIEKFSASIANEYVAFAWLLSDVFNEYKLSINFNSDMFHTELGAYFGIMYDINATIESDKDGNISIKLKHKFKHDSHDTVVNITPEIEREDVSFDYMSFEALVDRNNIIAPPNFFNMVAIDDQ